MAHVAMGMPSYPQEENQNFFFQEKSNEETVKEFFEIDSSSSEEEIDIGFEEWLKSLSNMSEEDAKKCVWEKLKSQISKDDVACLEKILEILSDELNKEKHTDLLFIEDELRKINSDINSIAVFEYLMILKGLNLIKLE